MATFLLLTSTFLLLLLVAATVRAVARDGTGHLPSVPSHHEWDETGPGTSFTTLRDARDEYLKMGYLPPIR